MCVGVVCDVGMEMDVLPKLHDRLWLLVATTHTPPPQVNEAFAAQYLAVEGSGTGQSQDQRQWWSHCLGSSTSGLWVWHNCTPGARDEEKKCKVFHWISLHRRGTRHSHLMCTDGRHHLENIICMHGTSY